MLRKFMYMTLLLSIVAVGQADICGSDFGSRAKTSLKQAGNNRSEISKALHLVPRKQREGMEFLVAFMPIVDLQSLSAEFLLQHVEYAYRAWQEAAWTDSISNDIFLNNILPYSNITETRESWRKDFYDRFHAIVKDAQTPGEAAVKLNQEIFKLTNVKYSTARKRPDQSPSETIDSGLASCSGLSVLLIDACRSVGVPARFVGTPMWSNQSGNHSWVEIWNGGWHFTGACEPAGDELDRGWFLGRASQADRNSQLHAIFAVSYRPTKQRFPLGWAPEKDWVWAVNVTDRYTRLKEELPAGMGRVMFSAVDKDGARLSAAIEIRNSAGKMVYQGTTNDIRFDTNDHLNIKVMLHEQYEILVRHASRTIRRNVKFEKAGDLTLFEFNTNR
ncbi:MAG: transglutaminase domain-containing protein [Planctomycetaceae bacterium]|nr:transglutaminase domain-containing protein [Planctomycetaceae bacterium]